MSEGKREEARTRYVSGNETLRALAKALGIGERTLQKWSKEDKWAQKRRKFRQRTAAKAETRLVGKRAKELSKLLEASDSMENALVKAAKAFEGDLDKNAWRYANGEHRAKNLESLSKAINKQVESRMRISGLMTRADEEKIALLMRKLEMEERKEAQEREQNGGVRLMLDGGVEELAE